MIDAAITERFVDSVGPIVVKEVRQGLRAKVFAIFFGTLLAACLSLALVAVAEASNGSARGRDYFGAYLTALGLVCFFVIPFVSFRSMARELEDETWVLLTLTGLGAASVVRGKWVSALTQVALFGSACAPFVLFSYFLNGIDLLQIVTALVLALGYSAFLAALALAIATQAQSKLGRTLTHFVVLGVLGLGTAGGVAFAWVLANEGDRLVSNAGFRNLVFALGLFSWALTWLLLESAAAGLALPSEAASAGPRRALLGVVGVALGFGVVAFVTTSGRVKDAAAGQVLTCLFLTAAGLFCVSERDGWPSQVPGGGWLKPGAVRSAWLTFFLFAASTGVWVALAMSDRTHDIFSRGGRALLGASAYPVLYLSLGVLAGRLTPLRCFAEPIATRIGFALCVVFGVVGSLLVSLVLEGRANGRISNALNPVVGLVNFLERSGNELDAALVMLGSATLLAGFLALVVLSARDEVRSS